MYKESFVQAGIAYLDREHPNWREIVQPEMVQIDDPRTCILGQIEAQSGSRGDYIDYITRREGLDMRWAVEHGFALEWEEPGAGITEDERTARAHREALLLSARWVAELVGTKMPTPSLAGVGHPSEDGTSG